MIAKTFILFCCMYIGAGHLCMLSPPQRTPLKNINKPGSDSCILMKEPCGGTKPTASGLSLVGGSNFTVIFQKNLDHFNKASPGFWSVSVAEAEGSNFTELYRIADSDLPSLTLYTTSVTIPEVKGNRSVSMVIQTRYITNNPEAPPAFYQCSDIMVRNKN